MWPMRKTLPLSAPWPGASVMPNWSRSVSTRSPESTPSGATIVVTTAERSSSGENSSRPIAFAPARAARPRRTWRADAGFGPPPPGNPRGAAEADVAVERRFEALLQEDPEGDVEGDDEWHGRRERRVDLRLRRERALPVPVEPRPLVALGGRAGRV